MTCQANLLRYPSCPELPDLVDYELLSDIHADAETRLIERTMTMKAPAAVPNILPTPHPCQTLTCHPPNPTPHPLEMSVSGGAEDAFTFQLAPIRLRCGAEGRRLTRGMPILGQTLGRADPVKNPCIQP